MKEPDPRFAAKAATDEFARMVEAITRYCEEHKLVWIGCMENDDELMFCPEGETASPANITSMWWLDNASRLGTFEEYCR